LFAAFLAAVAWSAPAMAGPLDPWGAHVGKGVFALTPFIFADQTPGVYPLLYGQYGVTDQFEMLVGAGVTVVPGFSFDSVEVMPRYFFTDTTGVALHATWVPGDTGVTVAPEWHGIYPIGPLTLTVNAGWGPYFGASGFAAGSAYALVAPEWFFTDASSLFVEVNPSVDLNDYGGADVDRFSMELVPGVSTSVAETHYFAVGIGIPVTGFDVRSIYLGAWYSIAFGGE
jgi:hypothetical protein